MSDSATPPGHESGAAITVDKNHQAIWILISGAAQVLFALGWGIFRFSFRCKQCPPNKYDDRLFYLAITTSLAHGVLSFLAISDGDGSSLSLILDSNILTLEKLKYSSGFLYIASIYFTKISLLLFYHRGHGGREHRILTWTVVATFIACGALSLFLVGLKCPLKHPWTFVDSQCSPAALKANWIAIATIDIFTELLLTGSSSWIVWSLQVCKETRLRVSSACLIRICIIGLISAHLSSILKEFTSPDPTLDGTAAVALAHGHIAVAIASCTLPCFQLFTEGFISGYGFVSHDKTGPNGRHTPEGPTRPRTAYEFWPTDRSAPLGVSIDPREGDAKEAEYRDTGDGNWARVSTTSLDNFNTVRRSEESLEKDSKNLSIRKEVQMQVNAQVRDSNGAIVTVDEDNLGGGSPRNITARMPVIATQMEGVNRYTLEFLRSMEGYETVLEPVAKENHIKPFDLADHSGKHAADYFQRKAEADKARYLKQRAADLKKRKEKEAARLEEEAARETVRQQREAALCAATGLFLSELNLSQIDLSQLDLSDDDEEEGEDLATALLNCSPPPSVYEGAGPGPAAATQSSSDAPRRPNVTNMADAVKQHELAWYNSDEGKAALAKAKAEEMAAASESQKQTVATSPSNEANNEPEPNEPSSVQQTEAVASPSQTKVPTPTISENRRGKQPVRDERPSMSEKSRGKQRMRDEDYDERIASGVREYDSDGERAEYARYARKQENRELRRLREEQVFAEAALNLPSSSRRPHGDRRGPWGEGPSALMHDDDLNVESMAPIETQSAAPPSETSNVDERGPWLGGPRAKRTDQNKTAQVEATRMASTVAAPTMTASRTALPTASPSTGSTGEGEQRPSLEEPRARSIDEGQNGEGEASQVAPPVEAAPVAAPEVAAVADPAPEVAAPEVASADVAAPEVAAPEVAPAPIAAAAAVPAPEVPAPEVAAPEVAPAPIAAAPVAAPEVAAAPANPPTAESRGEWRGGPRARRPDDPNNGNGRPPRMAPPIAPRPVAPRPAAPPVIAGPSNAGSSGAGSSVAGPSNAGSSGAGPSTGPPPSRSLTDRIRMSFSRGPRARRPNDTSVPRLAPLRSAPQIRPAGQERAGGPAPWFDFDNQAIGPAPIVQRTAARQRQARGQQPPSDPNAAPEQSGGPSAASTAEPTAEPTAQPTAVESTAEPTAEPSSEPTGEQPTEQPTEQASESPSAAPSEPTHP